MTHILLKMYKQHIQRKYIEGNECMVLGEGVVIKLVHQFLELQDIL